MYVNSYYYDKCRTKHFVVIHEDLDLGVIYIVREVKTFTKPSIIQREVFEEKLLSKEIVPKMGKVIDQPRVLTSKGKEHLEDKWKLVNYIFNENRLDYLDEFKRKKLLHKSCVMFNKKLQNVNSILYAFFMNGMVKYSLVDKRYYSKSASEAEIVSNGFRGRPNIDENPFRKDTDDIDKSNILKYTKKYHMKVNGLKKVQVYNRMIMECYSEFNEGELIIRYPHPSKDQFYRWSKKLIDEEARLRSRNRNYKYNKDLRFLEGSATTYAKEPGNRFELDSTIANVHLVDSRTRSRYIGRPTLYIIIDAFSRMIVGFNVTLENASYDEAVEAIASIFEDKRALCEKLGVKYVSDHWPDVGMPKTLVVDKAELKGQLANRLIESFSVEVANSPSKRPDLKPFVERGLGMIDNAMEGMTAGYVYNKPRNRAEPDSRKEAAYTLIEFKKLIVELVKEHNTMILRNYVSNVRLEKNNVPHVPVEIWRYYSRFTIMRQYSKDYIISSLQRHGKAKITREGIKFLGMRYIVPDYERNELRAHTKNTKKVTVSHKLSDVTSIHIKRPDGKYYVTTLTESCEKFRDMSLAEVKELQRKEKSVNNKYKLEHSTEKAEIKKAIVDLNDEVKNVKQESEMIDLKNIDKNRNEERKMNKNGNRNWDASEESIKKKGKKSLKNQARNERLSSYFNKNVTGE
tara:strand:- start:63 stop:2120 length:2058 start_codon:yes stop_codon:yes gene_type:complete